MEQPLLPGVPRAGSEVGISERHGHGHRLN